MAEWNQEFQEIKISLKFNTTITYTHYCSSQIFSHIFKRFMWTLKLINTPHHSRKSTELLRLSSFKDKQDITSWCCRMGICVYITVTHRHIPPPLNLRAVLSTVHHGNKIFTEQNLRTVEPGKECGYEKVGYCHTEAGRLQTIKNS